MLRSPLGCQLEIPEVSPLSKAADLTLHVLSILLFTHSLSVVSAAMPTAQNWPGASHVLVSRDRFTRCLSHLLEWDSVINPVSLWCLKRV